ncbi:MAG TPA: hypothetical protein VGF22_18750 [Acidimicrobiales bacterium]|jgi:hypothetical protein
MATLSFEGETHAELVAKVKRWLFSLEGEEELRTPAEVISAAADLTKEALRVIASAAPAPVAQSEMVRGLTAMGYQMTDAASSTVIDALDAMSEVTGDRVLKRVRDMGTSAVFEMNKAVAQQILKGMRGPGA